MKNLIALFLFVTCYHFVQAQESKPTKEETISFINRTINERNGQSMYGIGCQKLDQSTFTGESLVINTYCGQVDCISNIYESKQIRWDQLDTIFLKENERGIYYEVHFKTMMQYTATTKGCYGDTKGEITNVKKSTQFNLSVPVPDNKVASIKKAFFRLAEIEKEVNKDPFAN